MTDRWKMHRIGFVNFWLYDEEEFEFEDGKLLLRGQNGSGKSITTQSFIPFVLDGDRTPSRLDPFGSSDRWMEYFFLGVEGREESPGYLFLEFKKEESEEYRTIGIGQRAKRGKSMDFWGFVILDGRRIGYDLWLYKEVGSAKIPLDKRELRAELGEQNFYTDSQSEYKKHVNQYVFGFRKAEQYEQYIKLLVKVRAPKLSKEFKPTKVYEILNDSLQTLTDEDLRAMVDAMEKMDEIQDSLDMLNRAFSDVKIIRNEYTRYNQFMLAKKAQVYLKRKQNVDVLRGELDAEEAQQNRREEEQRTCSQRRNQLEDEKNLLLTERNGLMDTDLEQMDQKLETARIQRDAAREDERHWEEKIQECKEQIFAGEQQLKDIQGKLEEKQQKLTEQKAALQEEQETLQWERHSHVIRLMEQENIAAADELMNSLDVFKRLLDVCRKTLREYAEIIQRYDEAARQSEISKKQKIDGEQKLDLAQQNVVQCIEAWTTDIFAAEKNAEEWHPEHKVLEIVESKIKEYQSVEDAGEIQEILRNDYEQQRQQLADIRQKYGYEQKRQRQELAEVQQELENIRKQEELEPDRDDACVRSRISLQKIGIEAVPFYKTVEFADGLEEEASARLEAQLEKTGMLDALVVAEHDYEVLIQKCPEFLDTVLYAKRAGTSDFAKLVVNRNISKSLQESVERILSNIHEIKNTESGIYLGTDGCFRQGILSGKADKTGSAEFVGVLARKQRKEAKILELKNHIVTLEAAIREISEKYQKVQDRMELLWQEYQNLPGFSALNTALREEKECNLVLEHLSRAYAEADKRAQILSQKKNQKYQMVLKQCAAFPYSRTQEAYEEAAECVVTYRDICQEAKQTIIQIHNAREQYRDREERIVLAEQNIDEAFVQKRKQAARVDQYTVQIQQIEEYMNSPEIIQKAARLKTIREKLNSIETEREKLGQRLAVLQNKMQSYMDTIPGKKEQLRNLILEETCLKSYFEEELSLKLVLEAGNGTISECAEKAVRLWRESDRNREAGDMLQALYQVYQRHNGSLTNYGTSLEECFGDINTENTVTDAIRKRVRVASVWNGKKVYLEEFYRILKSAIEETELLIQAKDRELFEDILSQTISQQLTDRIAESKKWVTDMSVLMKQMDTSMGLHFSLEWKPRKAENDAELDTSELEQILLRDRELLTTDDIEKVAAHFRSKIRTEKQKVEEADGMINYMDLVRDALDYRKWFEFQMFYRKTEESRKNLTNAAFNRFSGGEKAMAMYVPLFAAVNAQYQKAEYKDHPRMIALDEAFAGVDDKNISSMFELVHKLDFDYIMNSQALWGCYETVNRLKIAELVRPQNSKVVSVIHYTWNGHERILDVQ